MTINELVKIASQDQEKAGWCEVHKDKGTQLMLIVTEISEAMEGERKNLMDDKLPHRVMAEVEMADAAIRIAAYCGRYGYDLQGAILEKMEYNRHRQDHKDEVAANQAPKRMASSVRS